MDVLTAGRILTLTLVCSAAQAQNVEIREPPQSCGGGEIIMSPGDYRCVEISSHINCEKIPVLVCPTQSRCDQYPTEEGRRRCRTWK